jgi:hypothetical protein
MQPIGAERPEEARGPPRGTPVMHMTSDKGTLASRRIVKS